MTSQNPLKLAAIAGTLATAVASTAVADQESVIDPVYGKVEVPKASMNCGSSKTGTLADFRVFDDSSLKGKSVFDLDSRNRPDNINDGVGKLLDIKSCYGAVMPSSPEFNQTSVYGTERSDDFVVSENYKVFVKGRGEGSDLGGNRVFVEADTATFSVSANGKLSAEFGAIGEAVISDIQTVCAATESYAIDNVTKTASAMGGPCLVGPGQR